jgi:hypothetical protein
MYRGRSGMSTRRRAERQLIRRPGPTRAPIRSSVWWLECAVLVHGSHVSPGEDPWDVSTSSIRLGDRLPTTRARVRRARDREPRNGSGRPVGRGHESYGMGARVLCDAGMSPCPRVRPSPTTRARIVRDSGVRLAELVRGSQVSWAKDPSDIRTDAIGPRNKSPTTRACVTRTRDRERWNGSRRPVRLGYESYGIRARVLRDAGTSLCPRARPSPTTRARILRDSCARPALSRVRRVGSSHASRLTRTRVPPFRGARAVRREPKFAPPRVCKCFGWFTARAASAIL